QPSGRERSRPSARGRVAPAREAMSERRTMTTSPQDPLIMSTAGDGAGGSDVRRSGRALGADIIIANAPDPVFVSDLEGKIVHANDAVSHLLGFRPDELIEQSLSKFISPAETREFTAELRRASCRDRERNAGLTAPSARGEVIPTAIT